MTGPVTIYVPAEKPKARLVSEAFAEGCVAAGVEVECLYGAHPLRGGLAVFYGVRPDTEATFRDALRRGRFLYIDNCYLGIRGEFFRITRDRLQHAGTGAGDPRRLEEFCLEILPWRDQGKYVLVCPPSDEWMRITGQPVTGTAWLRETSAAIRRATKRPIKVREKYNRAGQRNRPLGEDLAEAWCVVTYMSNVSTAALVAGVPVFVADGSIARPLAGDDLADIETPRMDGDREAWLSVLAANQWTLAEMSDGTAWRHLTATEST